MTENVKDYYRKITEQDIGEVARELLSGRISGESRNLITCDCPHHRSESKKSLHIMLDKQGWYCFGCGVGGDVLQLVEFIQTGTVTSGQSGPMPESHKQARDFLARRIGLPPLAEFGLSPEEQQEAEAERVYEGRVKLALTELAKYYHRQLKENPEALSLLKDNYSLSDEMIDGQLIGFADNSKGTRQILMSSEYGFTPDELAATGAFNLNSEGRPMPFFSKRITFPYWSRGSVSFMIGRKTPWTPDSKFEQGKYKKLQVHSEERPQIAKCINNSVLFNEDVLLTNPEYVIITEGVTDCLALMQAEFPAISPVTVRLRKDDWERIIPKLRQVRTVYICQDNELSQAGLKGALQTAGMLGKNGVRVKLVIIPPGKPQLAARYELEKRFNVKDAITPGELKKKLSGYDQSIIDHASNLLDDAKIDVNEFFREAGAREYFNELLRDAITPLEYAIGNLSENTPLEELNSQLEPLLSEIAFFIPLEQNRFLGMIQERVGKTVPLPTLKAQIRDVVKRHKSTKRKQKLLDMKNDKAKKSVSRGIIELPRKPSKSEGVLIPGRTELEFTHDLFKALSQADAYYNYCGNIVQIGESEHINHETGESFHVTGFSNVKPSGFVVDVEKYVDTGIYMTDEDGCLTFARESIGRCYAENALSSETARNLLKDINGITDICLPYFFRNELKFTMPGYDKRTGLWTAANAPVVEVMLLEQARDILLELFAEFCFLEPELDTSRAVTYILTPMLRAIMGDHRAMIFFASGNRPGVGKDYLLGLAPLIHTGSEPGFYAPCCDDDEYRKQIFSICASGERFFLTSNLKGHLSSPTLEQAATLPFFSGRTLGRSEQKTYPNLAVYGLSSNGLTISEDMERRIMDIRLEFYEEDIKKREFKRDLYEYVKERRPRILSAIMSLIVHWHGQGAICGDTMIPNFTRWSSLISGILPSCGFVNPFNEREKVTASMKTSGNRDDDNLKRLCEAWFEAFGYSKVTPACLRNLSIDNELFQYFDFDQRRFQVMFSKLLMSRADRHYGNFKICVDGSSKSNRYYLEPAVGQKSARELQLERQLETPQIFPESNK